jgi:alkylation response protein AidB-like acyl-CoA dehydrogenase
MSEVTSLDNPALGELCEHLARLTPGLDAPGEWPAEQLQMCGEAGVFRWFAPEAWGGWAWSEEQLLRGYIRLAEACLTTTFVITQRMGAVGRILAGDSQFARETLLPDLVAGHTFATVGISHLTTSRQHETKPVLRAEETANGFVLEGYSPWVTGASAAQHIVLGGTLASGDQILVALPTDLPGVKIEAPPPLVALSASQTGSVQLRQVQVERRWLLAGPTLQVMKQGAARTGGLQTSALAVGLASAAIDYLERQAEQRVGLASPAAALAEERDELTRDLIEHAAGRPGCSADELRTRANSLALRSTQAALVAAKGAGYVAGHAAGRWCREALFFLVWSCPQPVAEANLCELAGLGFGGEQQA